MNINKAFTVKGKTYSLPTYLPDATRAVTKGLDSADLANVGITGAVINTYHLMTSPGIDTILKVGGVRAFMNFDGFIATDSGGWQVFSLIKRNGRAGEITDAGIKFVIGGGSQELFTPEKSIQTQFDLGADIMVCLDDFSDPKASSLEIEKTVERTIHWAERSKEEYERQVVLRSLNDANKPLLFSVVQGGYDKDLRKQCIDKLVEIGFDGYGYGGYAVDDQGHLDLELSKFIADALPEDKLKFALGVGRPMDIVNLYQMRWDIFDCTLPTRDARHKRLYTFNQDLRLGQNLLDEKTYGFLYISRGKFKDDFGPISEFCTCHTCKNYTRAYLHHLQKINDTAYFRLATIHNLQIYTAIIESLRVHRFDN